MVPVRLVSVALAAGLAACAASPPRWTPPVPRSDDAVLYVSSDCSAVLVGPSTALTAAHCVEEPGALSVRVGARPIEVAGCAVHPDAYAIPRGCFEGPGETALEHDLAVLTLAEPAGVAPLALALAEPELRDGWWRGRAVRLLGWDRRPALVGALARRSGENRIVHREGGALVTEPAPDGFATTLGDSGGPALLRVAGVERVVGVLRGGPAPGSRRSVYAATFAPANARWLVEVLPAPITRELTFDEGARFGAAP